VGSAVYQQGGLLEFLSEGPLRCSLKLYGSPELVQRTNVFHPYRRVANTELDRICTI